MTAAREARNRTLSGLQVEGATRDDGRYLLYYSWPEEPPVDAGDTAGRQSTPEPDGQAWTPEAGPPETTGV